MVVTALDPLRPATRGHANAALWALLKAGGSHPSVRSRMLRPLSLTERYLETHLTVRMLHDVRYRH